MPLYEYQCDACGEKFEKMIRFSEQNQRPECPVCQSKETHKLVSIFASSTTGSTGGSSSSSCGGSGRFT